MSQKHWKVGLKTSRVLVEMKKVLLKNGYVEFTIKVDSVDWSLANGWMGGLADK